MTISNPFELLLQKNEGRPFVFDNDDMRTLHFDHKYIQSAMSISMPDKLLLSYTRAMMGFLLFQASPKKILMVGLGGGSLAKYCYRNLPSACVTVLEVSKEVIALRDDFLIPSDDHRLQIIHVDAAVYMHAQQEKVAEVIMLDGFSADGPAHELITSDFYAACLHSLTPGGILVSNLWDSPASLIAAVAPALLGTDWRIWWCKTPDSDNYIAFFVRDNDTAMFRTLASTRAKKLDEQFDLQLSGLIPSFQLAPKCML
ncbi:fused MFS/spermidine synthase [Collimonas sp. NPDC087041]|uniref:fused MFS/spermidine synthase n=1 Tax=Collimonas sp. NPDC087041 TaxID=3363960 RepID=UPI00382B687A